MWNTLLKWGAIVGAALGGVLLLIGQAKGWGRASAKLSALGNTAKLVAGKMATRQQVGGLLKSVNPAKARSVWNALTRRK